MLRQQIRKLSTLPQRASLGRSTLPAIKNEPTCTYMPNTKERELLVAAVNKLKATSSGNGLVDIPCIVGGKEIRTGNVGKQTMPSDHSKVIATFHQANKEVAQMAIDATNKAKAEWEAMSFEDRSAIFMKAADLLSTKYRYDIMAATMLGQGKNSFQAEIDCINELADFWRYSCKFAEQIYQHQPPENSQFVWNRLEYRPLEGFVYAITPFNFTAIGANLPSAPAIMGNTTIWKPSNTAALSNYIALKVLMEAGLPEGVINFLPGDGLEVSDVVFNSKDFSALHFTGSTATFNKLWSTIGNNLPKYRSYPRIVGETGGKNFHFVHKSADPINVINHSIRSAFEYSGQKCSACSRMYVPDNLWPTIRQGLVDEIAKIKLGQPDDFTTFMSAVIDARSFDKIKGYLDRVKSKQIAGSEILVGGNCDNSKGYFIEPTVIVTTDPHSATMKDELFGPVLTIYVYPEAQYEQTLALCESSSTYALTGSLFASDRKALQLGSAALRNAAGNFYINDKSTGAVVGQQPFGGARGSGTNDKAGSMYNLLRFVSPRAIKETFVPVTTWSYPYMQN